MATAETLTTEPGFLIGEVMALSIVDDDDGDLYPLATTAMEPEEFDRFSLAMAAHAIVTRLQQTGAEPTQAAMMNAYDLIKTLAMGDAYKDKMDAFDCFAALCHFYFVHTQGIIRRSLCSGAKPATVQHYMFRVVGEMVKMVFVDAVGNGSDAPMPFADAIEERAMVDHWAVATVNKPIHGCCCTQVARFRPLDVASVLYGFYKAREAFFASAGMDATECHDATMHFLATALVLTRRILASVSFAPRGYSDKLLSTVLATAIIVVNKTMIEPNFQTASFAILFESSAVKALNALETRLCDSLYFQPCLDNGEFAPLLMPQTEDLTQDLMYNVFYSMLTNNLSIINPIALS
jgi:hypothetical protein